MDKVINDISNRMVTVGYDKKHATSTAIALYRAGIRNEDEIRDTVKSWTVRYSNIVFDANGRKVKGIGFRGYETLKMIYAM